LILETCVPRQVGGLVSADSRGAAGGGEAETEADGTRVPG